MKVLVLVTKGEIGGAQVYVKELAGQFKNGGHEVTIATGAKYNEFLANSCAETGITFKKFKYLSRSINPVTNILFCIEFYEFLKNNSFDLVILNSSNSLQAALVCKLVKNKPKTIFVFHGLSYLDPSVKNFFKRFFAFLPFKLFLRFVDKNVFVSKNNLNEAINMCLVKEGTVAPPGVNVDFKSKEESINFFEKKFKLDLRGKTVIGSIGRLAYPKNYEFFISAFASLANENKNIVGLIVGEGSERKKYEALINGLGLTNLFFMPGEIAHASRYIKVFDVFILCSIYEGIPITLLEAMAAGLPVLAPDVGGIPEIVGTKSKMQLYKSADNNDFIKKIAAYINNTELSTSIVNQNSINLRKYSWENTYLSFLDSVN